MRRRFQNATIVRLYKTGKTLRQIAEKYGVTDGCIAGRLKEEGVPRRKRGRPAKLKPSKIDKWILDMRRQGYSYQKIADSLGRKFSRQRAEQRYKKWEMRGF